MLNLPLLKVLAKKTYNRMINNALRGIDPGKKPEQSLKNGDFLIKHLGDRYYLILLHAYHCRLKKIE
jgi:hypothetical protein